MKRINNTEWMDGEGVVYVGNPKDGFTPKEQVGNIVEPEEPVALHPVEGLYESPEDIAELGND